MKKRMLGLLTALALCLSLLPGTALAEGDPGVIINSTPLESGKQYVAGEYGVIEKPADAPADTPYLDYRDGVLTVHGQMDLGNYGPRIDGAVTFTGGGDSCLETGSIYFNNGTTSSVQTHDHGRLLRRHCYWIQLLRGSGREKQRLHFDRG